MNVFGVGPTEIFVVLIVILVLFGPDKLPEIAKRIGGASREIRENLDSLSDQMNTALETSMELDKAQMIQPAESEPEPATAQVTAPTNSMTETETHADENRILREDSVAKLPPAAPPKQDPD